MYSKFVLFGLSNVDINECNTVNGKGPCSDTCTNKPGGYECGCFGDRVLTEDQLTCKGT